MRRELLKKGLLSVTYRYHVDDSPDSLYYEEDCFWYSPYH